MPRRKRRAAGLGVKRAAKKEVLIADSPLPPAGSTTTTNNAADPPRQNESTILEVTEYIKENEPLFDPTTLPEMRRVQKTPRSDYWDRTQ